MSQKPADTEYPIHELLRQRWSPRAFAARSVEPEKLRSLFEAVRWAPSSFNEQPWSFLVAIRETPGEYERMLSCLVEGNIRWAQNAPVLLLSVAKLHFERTGKPNRHAFHDVGLGAENLVMQATALGLTVHQMAGFQVEKARALFGIPEGYEPVAMMAVGYAAEADSLPEELRARELAPRTRKALEEFVFTGGWGKASPLVSGGSG
ncbi:MAG: nitroreductase family protein [Terriglobia bacterium]